VTVVGEGAEIVGVDGNNALFAGSGEDSVIEGASEEVGKDGDDVELHSRV
jgi:hypothetical protein